MIFGRVPLAAAAGAILAHGVRGAGFAFAKGRVLAAADLAILAAAGVERLVVARPAADDVGEDAAAAAIAQALAGDGIVVAPTATGRANLHAAAAGLVGIDTGRIDALNRVDEAITVATLPAFAPVAAGQMLATVKIIPFAVPAARLAAALAAAEAPPPLRLARFRPLAAALIQTRLGDRPKPSLLTKTADVVAARLAALGGRLAAASIVGHDEAEVAAALTRQHRLGRTPLLVLGASAISDREDVVPRAVVAAAGRVRHLGMPVDPGNLLMLAEIDGTPVIGLPGCARSPARNGFDLVLERLAAGLTVAAGEVMAMGVGGLMLDVLPRPLPRADATPPPVAAAPTATTSAAVESTAAAAETATAAAPPSVAALVLAAGRGSRFTAGDKLATAVFGKPLLRWPVEAALAAGLAPVVVVLGDALPRLRPLLAGLPVTIVANPDPGSGLAASLRAGLAALPAAGRGVAVLLADMPLVGAGHLRTLATAFAAAGEAAVVVPTVDGRRGNPVIWPRALFPALAGLQGDAGGRALLDAAAPAEADGRPWIAAGAVAVPLLPVAMADDAVLVDIDDQAALARLEGGG